MPVLPNLYRLQIFQTVVQKESFSAAAEVFHTSQPNISKHIRLLEQEVGTALIDRQGGRVTLTEAGRLVLKTTGRLLEQVAVMNQALQDLQGGNHGHLRLAASELAACYLLPVALAQFRQQYPDVEISMAVGNYRQVIKLVIDQQVDMGLLDDQQPVPGAQIQPWISDQLVLAAGSILPLSQSDHISKEDLAGQLFLVREESSITCQQMRQVLSMAGLDSARTMEIASSEGIKSGIAAGVGISMVSLRSIDVEIRAGKIKVLEVPGFLVDRAICIAAPKEKRQSVAALKFWGHLHRSIMSFI